MQSKVKKTSPITVVFLLIIGLFIVYVIGAFGASVDKTLVLQEDGETLKPDYPKAFEAFQTDVADVGFVIGKIIEDGTNARKFTIFSALGIGVFAIIKATDSKRFHRRGVEHGSARWGKLFEAKKLADKGYDIRIIKNFNKLRKQNCDIYNTFKI